VIRRNNPEVGYLDAATFDILGFTQVAVAGDTTYLSGIAPFTGGPPQFTVIGVGSMDEQVTFVLDVLEKCLESEDLTLANLVAVTVYATDLSALMACAPRFAKRFGDAPPTSTWVEITGLAHPDQLVEITAVAAA
jgi:enamine deaminase RidA (YjgF/YER057c/UK114 family)